MTLEADGTSFKHIADTKPSWKGEVAVFQIQMQAMVEREKIASAEKMQARRLWLSAVSGVILLLVSALWGLPIASNYCWWKENDACVETREVSH